MSGTQILGVVFIIASLIIGFIGFINVMDLAQVSGNQMAQAAIELSGMSMNSLWIKYGGMSAGSIVLLIVGINLAKKKD